MRVLVFSLALALLASACGKDVKPATVVLVELASDSDDIASIDVAIRDENDRGDGGRHHFELGAKQHLPFSFAVAPNPGRENATFTVVATGRDVDGDFVVETKAQAKFVAGKSLSFTLWMLARCDHVMCDAGKTCDVETKRCDEIPAPKLYPAGTHQHPAPDAGMDAMVETGSGGQSAMSGGSGGDHGGMTGGAGGMHGGSGGIGEGTGGMSGPLAMDGGPPEAGPTPDDMAIETVDTPCAHNGDLACPGHNASSTLVCGNGVWKKGRNCSSDQVCDPASGMCSDVATACIAHAPNDEVCDGKTRRRCDEDRLGYESDACQSHAHCDDSTTVQCVCDADYDDISGTCEKHDDCVNNTCGHGSCNDGVDDYTCACNSGYMPDDSGHVCVDIPDCDSNPCGHGTCNDLVNGHSCTCDPGYQGTTTCSDIDECAGTNACDTYCDMFTDCPYTCQNRAPYYQCRGQFADWPMPDSTPGAKVAPSYTVGTDTVTDEVTGLMWVKTPATTFTNCIGPGHDPYTNTCNFSESLAYCAQLNWAGFTDWRLPTKIETESIMDFTVTDPLLASAFPRLAAGKWQGFWTSSMVAGQSNVAWHVALTDGTSSANPTGYSYAVRCVRNR
jgi:hypothetical protein